MTNILRSVMKLSLRLNLRKAFGNLDIHTFERFRRLQSARPIQCKITGDELFLSNFKDKRGWVLTGLGPTARRLFVDASNAPFKRLSTISESLIMVPIYKQRL